MTNSELNSESELRGLATVQSWERLDSGLNDYAEVRRLIAEGEENATCQGCGKKFSTRAMDAVEIKWGRCPQCLCHEENWF